MNLNCLVATETSTGCTHNYQLIPSACIACIKCDDTYTFRGPNNNWRNVNFHTYLKVEKPDFTGYAQLYCCNHTGELSVGDCTLTTIPTTFTRTYGQATMPFTFNFYMQCLSSSRFCWGIITYSANCDNELIAPTACGYTYIEPAYRYGSCNVCACLYGGFYYYDPECDDWYPTGCAVVVARTNMCANNYVIKNCTDYWNSSNWFLNCNCVMLKGTICTSGFLYWNANNCLCVCNQVNCTTFQCYVDCADVKALGGFGVDTEVCPKTKNSYCKIKPIAYMCL